MEVKNGITTCTGGCSIKACIHDGKIQSVIPSGCYPEEMAQPRGCLKGVTFPDLLYGEQRIMKPRLRQENGSHLSFSWDQALDEAAQRLEDVMERYGSESVGVIYKDLGSGYVHKGSLHRLAALCGWTVMDGLEMNGGLASGISMTFGEQPAEIDSIHWNKADMVLVFGNSFAPVCVPDSYFLSEARANGARVVVFDPGLSPVTAGSGVWYSIPPACEAAAALGIARILIREGLFDKSFISRYTDLPLLVRCDTGERLRACDTIQLREASAEDFAAYGEGLFSVSPNNTRPMNRAVLDQELDVTLVDGKTVQVKPAFLLLMEQLEDYTPEYVEEVTKIPEEELSRTAREAAGAETLHIIYGGGGFQHYHGDLGARAIALLAVLTGNIGRPGGGVSVFSGQYRTRLDVSDWICPEGQQPNHLPYAYFAGGPTQTMASSYPENGIRALIVGWSNPFDQHNASNFLRERAESGELELIISLDFLNTTTSRYSHIQLPGVSWYEKLELVSSPVHSKLQLMQPVIEPVGECMPELWTCRELAERLIPNQKEYFPADDPEKAVEQVIENILAQNKSRCSGITLEALKEGPQALSDEETGFGIPFYKQVHEGIPFGADVPWIKTGRIEIYREEQIFQKLGEQLPVHKQPFAGTEYAMPGMSSRYPFTFLAKNSVHRIHGTNSRQERKVREDKIRIWLNPSDGEVLSVSPGEEVKVSGPRHEFTALAELDSGICPGTAVYEGAWWSRFTDGSDYTALVYPYVKPTQEVYYVPGVWAPNMAWNESVCRIQKIR